MARVKFKTKLALKKTKKNIKNKGSKMSELLRRCYDSFSHANHILNRFGGRLKGVTNTLE